jgi:hypothetical protein
MEMLYYHCFSTCPYEGSEKIGESEIKWTHRCKSIVRKQKDCTGKYENKKTPNDAS